MGVFESVDLSSDGLGDVFFEETEGVGDGHQLLLLDQELLFEFGDGVGSGQGFRLGFYLQLVLERLDF